MLRTARSAIGLVAHAGRDYRGTADVRFKTENCRSPAWIANGGFVPDPSFIVFVGAFTNDRLRDRLRDP